MSMEIDVFVIGGCHHNTLGVIRSLGEKGILPLVIIESDNKNPYIAYSKYIKKKWIVADEQQVLSVLLTEAQNYKKRPVVIACSDNLSSLLDLHYDELTKYYALPGANIQGRITHLMDKEIMSQLARSVGFIVPQSVSSETYRNDEISIPLPWIIKPLVSKCGVKTDIERVYTPEDWQDYKSRHHTNVQVQQLIDKDYEYQLIGLSLAGGAEVIIPGVSRVIRPQNNTNTGFLHYESLDKTYQEVLSLCKSFVMQTGYSGLFSMEFLRGKDGKDYFMEINFRNDGNAICVTEAGLNLPYIWFLYNCGKDYSSELLDKKIASVYVMPEFDDFRLFVHRKVGLLTWIKDFRRTDRFMEYDKHDKSPFIHQLKESVQRILKKLV